MFYKIRILELGFILTILVLFSGCQKSNEKSSYPKHLLINELMTSNSTGLTPGAGAPAGWIEIKNTKDSTINLEGYILLVQGRAKTDDSTFKEKKWIFPDNVIKGGEHLIVFADKEFKGSLTNQLIADLKFPKKGGVIKLLTPKEEIISEIDYEKLPSDKSYALQPDSTYMATYWQSPGFENSKKGYVHAMEEIYSRREGPLLIWEFMTSGKKSDQSWVELKNSGDSAIDLSQYELWNGSKKTEKWRLPDKTLNPGEIITIQLSGKSSGTNPLSAPLKPGKNETVILTKSGEFIDGINASMTPANVSVGRSANKEGIFFYQVPSKNTENGKDGKRYVADVPRFNYAPGVYPEEEKISLRLQDSGSKVHFTINGSLPTTSSPLFKDSLVIKQNLTLRAFAEGDSLSLRSETVTATYFPGVKHELPVVNITVNHGDLYDYNYGIYAEGPGFDEEWPHLGANYWRNLTKKANFELFDEGPGFSSACGLKIFGGFSRSEDKKSFRVKFKKEYAKQDAKYDFFGIGEEISLKNIVLRSGAQDYARCMIRDEFFTDLMQANSPNLLTQLYRPVALYINGNYFGLYYLKEKINKHFVSRKLNVPSDSIDIIVSKGYFEEGDGKAYRELIRYVSSHDLSKEENYKLIAEQIDLIGLIDFKLGQIYSGNTDVGNVRYVKSNSKESDGKWHFIFYDLDATWVGQKPTAEFYLSTTADTSPFETHPHNILINSLLKNKDFRELFLQRLSYHLSNTFSPENATAVFDRLVEQIRPEMNLNCKRWPQLSYKQWEKNIADFRAKFDKRPMIILEDLRKYLKITPEENKKYFSDFPSGAQS